MAAMLPGRNNRLFFPLGTNVLSNAKYFHRSSHATWLPCKTSIGTKSQRLPGYKNYS